MPLNTELISRDLKDPTMFENLFTIDSLVTFLILTALETVLGFDNLLYISIEAKKVDPPARPGCGARASFWPSACGSCCYSWCCS